MLYFMLYCIILYCIHIVYRVSTAFAGFLQGLVLCLDMDLGIVVERVAFVSIQSAGGYNLLFHSHLVVRPTPD